MDNKTVNDYKSFLANSKVLKKIQKAQRMLTFSKDTYETLTCKNKDKNAVYLVHFQTLVF